MTTPYVIHTINELRTTVKRWREQGLRVALVPTMGALHAGHLSLVEIAQHHCQRVVVSVFVNPTQFGPNEDFDNYPRTLDSDLAKLNALATDVVYAPSVTEMYPMGPQRLASIVRVNTLSEDMEGAEREGHFDGMATVVTKLLLQCLPDIAVFGEKDYQQLQIVRQFVTDLNIPVEIVGGETIREADGLAMSSRNTYLSSEQRAIAAQLNQILKRTIERMQHDANNPEHIAAVLNWGRNSLLSAGFDAVDYLTLRDTDALIELKILDQTARLLCAARIGPVRLLDNMAIDLQPLKLCNTAGDKLLCLAG